MGGADILLERSEALRHLRELATRSASARGQVAVIGGEAGVGKTSLVEALCAHLDPTVRVAWGHCDALFTPRQFGPLHDLAPVLGAAVADALVNGSSPVVLFPKVLAALNDLPAGSVVIFEDVHWADHGSLDLLKFVARRMAPLRVLLVLTYRNDEVGPEHPLHFLLGDLPASTTSRIDLTPLSLEAVTQLAGSHGRDGTALYRTTGGNPFFVAEILAQPEGDDGRLPVSVRDAVLTRVARIGADERRLLDSLCVAPDPVSLRLVEKLHGPTGVAACMACEARGLIGLDETQGIRFRHELARVALYDALPAGERQAHRQRLLRVYLGLGEAIKPERIVHHAALLGDAETLLEYAPRAAAHAAALGACKEASALLGLALRYADRAGPELSARLHEDWAYQTSLFEISDRVLEARREALARWRALDRPERVGDNLRWLWRLHWYRGEVAEAETAAAESLAILESIPPSPELARAYALRSHVNMLRGQRADAMDWGGKAIEMAAGFGDQETRVQALVTVATAMLFDGDAGGRELMDQALVLALRHGLHEEAARVYTNYSEYAIVVCDWPLAERLVLDGLAFDVKYGLDSWTFYLMGRHAQLRLGQGRLNEAETLARGALAQEGATLLMALPALTTLATLRSRLGAEDAEALLERVLQTALQMREQQRITPARLAWIEHHYLRGQPDAAGEHLAQMLAFGTDVLRPWDAGALRVWAQRLDLQLPPEVGRSPTEAQALELAGDHAGAAAALDCLQSPFEAALCRLAGVRAGKAELLRPAEENFEVLGCTPGLAAARSLAGRPDIAAGRSKARRRGPYGAARRHPLGLTRKEVQIIALMTEGASNADIARNLSRSTRTVEHHVSAILGKLNASNRLEAILRVMAEPWIAQV